MLFVSFLSYYLLLYINDTRNTPIGKIIILFHLLLFHNLCKMVKSDKYCETERVTNWQCRLV